MTAYAASQSPFGEEQLADVSVICMLAAACFIQPVQYGLVNANGCMYLKQTQDQLSNAYTCLVCSQITSQISSLGCFSRGFASSFQARPASTALKQR